MIELARVGTVIEAPVEQVYAYVTNMENYGAWFPGVVGIRSANNLPHCSVGKQYIETLQLPEGEVELVIDVDQSIPQQLYITKGNLPSVLPQMTMQFSTLEDGSCRFDLSYHSRNETLTEDSDVICALRDDLSQRAQQALINLQQRLMTASV